MKAEEKAREHHLAQTEAGPKGGVKCHGRDGETIDEEDGEEGVDETKMKDWNGQCADSKRGDNHVRRHPLSGYVSTSSVHICPVADNAHQSPNIH